MSIDEFIDQYAHLEQMKLRNHSPQKQGESPDPRGRGIHRAGSQNKQMKEQDFKDIMRFGLNLIEKTHSPSPQRNGSVGRNSSPHKGFDTREVEGGFHVSKLTGAQLKNRFEELIKALPERKDRHEALEAPTEDNVRRLHVPTKLQNRYSPRTSPEGQRRALPAVAK